MNAIELSGISKKYYLRGQQLQGISDILPRAKQNIVKLMSKNRGRQEEFWALKDINLTVKKGEILGIIGANGAGKSTILKILSGITEPTEGKMVVNGKIASLIEVGAGFHPDLTGRENIYLNGSILGMSRKEINENFARIVEFSEIEQFIDQPVKRYSSGMYVRLGFAVAIHVNPDILLVDEVLSVGDMVFQRKCMQRMKEIWRKEKTIIFISHNLPALESLCEKALWLEAGKIKMIGEPHDVITAYIDMVNERRISESDSKKEQPSGFGEVEGSGEIVITDVQIIDCSGNNTESVEAGKNMKIRLYYEAFQRVVDPHFGISIWNSSGLKIYTLVSKYQGLTIDSLDGKGIVECTIPSVPLLPGSYSLRVAITDSERLYYDFVDKAKDFLVRASVDISDGLAMDGNWGVVYIPAEWKIETNI